MPNDVPQKLKELVCSCWAANPDERPDFLAVADKLSEAMLTEPK